MPFSKWNLSAEQVFAVAPVIPVLVINDLNKAIPLAQALLAGGINILEITLRSPVSLDAVRLLTATFPQALIGVGTVLNPEQLKQACDAGAQFAISPGQTPELLKAGREASIPFIPGIATVSELMAGLAQGYTNFKLFPAVVAGGVALLKSLYSPFPQARFCPTGGINASNYTDFLELSNVSCVGGSWLAPEQSVTRNEWLTISEICLAIKDKANV